MNKTLNTFLGIGGAIAMIAAPLAAYGVINTQIAVNSNDIKTLKINYKNFAEKQDKQIILLVRVATKLGIDSGDLSLNDQ